MVFLWNRCSLSNTLTNKLGQQTGRNQETSTSVESISIPGVTELTKRLPKPNLRPPLRTKLIGSQICARG